MKTIIVAFLMRKKRYQKNKNIFFLTTRTSYYLEFYKNFKIFFIFIFHFHPLWSQIIRSLDAAAFLGLTSDNELKNERTIKLICTTPYRKERRRAIQCLFNLCLEKSGEKSKRKRYQKKKNCCVQKWTKCSSTL